MSANIGKNGIVKASLIDGNNKVSIMQEDIEVGSNLIIGGSGKEKKGFFKNCNSITSDGGEFRFISAAGTNPRYPGVAVAEGFEVPIANYTPGESLVWSYDIMLIQKDGVTATECLMGQRYGSVGTIQAWQRVTAHHITLPTTLNVWEHREIRVQVPSTNYPQPSNANSDCVVRFNNTATTAGTLIIRLKNIKLERGSKATPWCPNPADGLGEKPAIYKSPIKANDFIEI